MIYYQWINNLNYLFLLAKSDGLARGILVRIQQRANKDIVKSGWKFVGL